MWGVTERGFTQYKEIPYNKFAMPEFKPLMITLTPHFLISKMYIQHQQSVQMQIQKKLFNVILNAALQVTGCQECLMPLHEAGANKQLFCRRSAVVEELCHQVMELREEVNKLGSIQVNKQEVLREPTQKDALDLLLVNRVDLVSEVEIGGHLGHSDHEVIKFKISVDRSKSASKTSTLDMRRVDFRLLRELDEDSHLTNMDTDKAEVFKLSLPLSSVQMMDQRGLSTLSWRTMTENDQLPVDPGIVQDLLLHLDPYKSMGAERK
ncbi:hypothetical protein BTVI_69140 [Pitangus sulphuratus]|nr:hypothetical protein BTVI_69140 [Pitangus sulphuratus]